MRLRPRQAALAPSTALRVGFPMGRKNDSSKEDLALHGGVVILVVLAALLVGFLLAGLVYR